MTKVIVTGATGYIGSNVVKQCIKDKTIKEVLVLTRKPIAKTLSTNPKVKVIIHEEFSSFPDSVLQQLLGAQGCIWTIGGDIKKFPDSETAKKVGIGYTCVAAQAFRDYLTAFAAPNKPFRFVYCSSRGAEQDQNAKLWVQAENRKLKGAAENGIFDIASGSEDFAAFALRPGGVYSEESGLFGSGASKITPTTRVDVLAKALIAVCVKGADKDILENVDVNEVGDLEKTLLVNSLA